MLNIYVVFDVRDNFPVSAFTNRRECEGWILFQKTMNHLDVFTIENGGMSDIINVSKASDFIIKNEGN